MAGGFHIVADRVAAILGWAAMDSPLRALVQCPLCAHSETISAEAADALADAIRLFMHDKMAPAVVTELENIRNHILNQAERATPIDPLLL